ncbi:MAG TPA: ABC transporter substrate-binding protein [Candidatus Dormibacteraeota bacterium]
MRAGTWLLAGLLALTACSVVPGPRPVGPTPTPALTAVTVRVGHVASTEWAPLYVALDRGYFSDLNVKVELVAIRLGQRAVDLVGRDQVDAVVTDFGADMFNALAGGKPFRVVGSMPMLPATGSPFVLEVARPLLDAGTVRTIADLKGRNIAIDGGTGAGSGYLADLVLQRGGVRLADLSPIIDLATDSMETAFQVHGLDTALVRQPAAASIEQAGLAAPIGAPPAGASWAGVLFNDKLSGWAAQRFVDALARAARDLAGPGGTSDATLAILAKYTGISVDVLRTIPPYAWDGALRPDGSALAGIQATYRSLGLLQYGADLAPARISDGSYARQAAGG